MSHKASRSSYIWLKPEVELLVTEIKPERMAVADFPGFRNVIVTHEILQTIVRQQVPEWQSALSSVKGIYLITDTFNGKQYVGKASGERGIWGRWSEYITTGHGGNVKLRELLELAGQGYQSNFQFSVLEVVDLQASDDEILRRESHWMQVLSTRSFGLN